MKQLNYDIDLNLFFFHFYGLKINGNRGYLEDKVLFINNIQNPFEINILHTEIDMPVLNYIYFKKKSCKSP